MNDGSVFQEQTLFIIAIVIFLVIAFKFYLKKTTSVADYVWGHNIGFLPISMSLFATHISCITASLGSEYYQYGIHILFETVTVAIISVLIIIQATVLLPFKFISVNQYLVLRFGSRIKLFASATFLISQVTLATVICFSAAVQIKSIMDTNFMATFLGIYIFCFILSALGGFEGVVWTEVLQSVIMLGSIIVTAVLVTSSVGGVGRVFKAAYESDRLDIDFSFDPTKRMTFWTIICGQMMNWMAFNSLFSPAMYQRFVSLGSEFVTRGAILSGFITILFKVIIWYLGNTMYAYYQGCDPVKSGQIDRYDQIQPFFINEISKKWVLLRGIYTIGFVCAGISTMTTIINTCGIVAYQDFLQNRFNSKSKTWKAKAIIVLVQLVMLAACTVLFLGIEGGENIAAFIPLYGSPCAVIASTFILGIFVPHVHSKGVIIASVVTLPLSLLWAWCSNLASIQGLVKYPLKPLSVDNCPFNVTVASLETPFQDEVFPLLRVTPFFQPMIMFWLHFIISVVTCHFFKSGDEERVERSLVHPWCHKFVPVYDLVPLQVKEQKEVENEKQET